MPTDVYQTAQGVVNASGAISMVFVSPGLGTTWTGVITVRNATGAEIWEALVAGAYWGTFYGTGQFGVVQCSGGEQVSIVGSGLTPARGYQAALIAFSSPTDLAPPAFPQPAPSGTTGTTGATGINQITSNALTLNVTNPTGPITNLDASNLIARVQENVTVVAASGSGIVAIPDVTTATLNLVTLTGNPTLTFPTAAAGKNFALNLAQDATGSRTVTWPGNIKWAGGTAPTLTATPNKQDTFSFVCYDGNNWIGYTTGQNF